MQRRNPCKKALRSQARPVNRADAIRSRAMTLIESAKMNPQAYLADVLDRIHDYKITRLDELLPWNWTPKARVTPQTAAA